MSKVKEIGPAEFVRIQDKLMREVPIHEVECKSCDKTGERDNWHASYPFHVENVERFSQFCLQSGGFEIS